MLEKNKPPGGLNRGFTVLKIGLKKPRHGRVVSKTGFEVSEYHMKHWIECLKLQYFSDKERSNFNLFLAVKIPFPNSPHACYFLLFFDYHKCSINLPPSPPPCGRLFILTPVEGGGLIETAGLVYLKKAMVSLLHKELEYKLENLKYKKSSAGAPNEDVVQNHFT